MDGRIKCPWCGSTSQITLLWTDSDNYGTKTQKEYGCKCGCEFSVTFTQKQTFLLKDGKKN